MTELISSGTNILFKKIEQEDEKRSTILVSLGDINPALIYGQVLNTGHDCLNEHDGDFIYVRDINASKLIHLGEEYWIVDEDDLLVYIEGEQTERTIKKAVKPPTHPKIGKEN